MRKHLSEQRFKTAGARILRSRKLPKDFFANHDKNLRSFDSHHTSNRKNNTDIFQFTFMAKQHLSLRKSCSQTYESSKQCIFPKLKNMAPQKENILSNFSLIKPAILRYSSSINSGQNQCMKKLQRISLNRLNIQQQRIQ